MNPTRAMCVLASSSVVLFACGNAEDLGAASGVTDSHEEALAAVKGITPWPDQLKVCFTDVPNPDGGFTNFLLARTATQLALDETWGASSAIDFTYVGDCRAPLPSGMLAIRLIGGRSGSGFCGGNGLGASCQFDADSAVDGVLGLKGLAVHEVGHALGFGHEHQRAFANNFYEGVLCAFEASRLAQANQVLAAGVPLCFQTDGCPGGVGLLDLGTATQWRDNRVARVFNDLTPFDDLSIMNYCSSAFGRTDHRLSDFDRLGIEMLYPGDRNARGITVRSGAAFVLPGSILSRSDVPLVLTTDWSSRGALDTFFSGMTWRLNGALVNSGVSGTFTFASDGVRTASVAFTDVPTLRGHSGSRLVEASNSKHTALLMTVLP